MFVAFVFAQEQTVISFLLQKGMICMKTNFVYNFRFLRKSKILPIQIIASTEIQEKKVRPNMIYNENKHE